MLLFVLLGFCHVFILVTTFTQQLMSLATNHLPIELLLNPHTIYFLSVLTVYEFVKEPCKSQITTCPKSYIRAFTAICYF